MVQPDDDDDFMSDYKIKKKTPNANSSTVKVGNSN